MDKRTYREKLRKYTIRGVLCATLAFHSALFCIGSNVAYRFRNKTPVSRLVRSFENNKVRYSVNGALWILVSFGIYCAWRNSGKIKRLEELRGLDSGL